MADGAIAFHGAAAGEKLECIGRAAVLAAEEIVAEIPSYFLDPEPACPATTLYLSAQVHGPVEEVTDPEAKARVLRALMAKFQPEGGHVPIEALHPLYRRAIDAVSVLRVPLERLDGKAKLAQNRRPEERAGLLQLLWQRGAPGDARAIELVRAFNAEVRVPAFLESPAGTTLHCHLDSAADADRASELLDGAYWNTGLDRRRIAEAHLRSAAWVGCKDAQGRLVASARAIADAAKWAWIYDVIVEPDWRGRGLGKAMMKLLLDHPAVRSARFVKLTTRDAMKLYQQFGFRDVRELPPRGFHSVEMALVRA
jgi:GNAT superfamily N-acetyltransferase/nitroimidazol reductase NimA-like FMN-containing flavoprotein (pyridoxamine 5'-phosphate oxidase superfamily)